jgi:hypothetical protein
MRATRTRDQMRLAATGLLHARLSQVVELPRLPQRRARAAQEQQPHHRQQPATAGQAVPLRLSKQLNGRIFRCGGLHELAKLVEEHGTELNEVHEQKIGAMQAMAC